MMPPRTPPGVPPATPPGTPPTTPPTPLVGGRKFFFLNGGDFLGDGLRRHQPAGVELARNHFDDLDSGGSGGRRWRRRRRGRRHQETGQLGLRKDIEVDHRQDHRDDRSGRSARRRRPARSMSCWSLTLDECLLEHTKLPFHLTPRPAQKCPPATFLFDRPRRALSRRLRTRPTPAAGAVFLRRSA